MPEPKPVFTHICSVCELPWYKHMTLAQDRHLAENPGFYNEVILVPTIEDCVELLKRAAQGPQGPAGAPGPTGPMGAQGEPGASA